MSVSQDGEPHLPPPPPPPSSAGDALKGEDVVQCFLDELVKSVDLNQDPKAVANGIGAREPLSKSVVKHAASFVMPPLPDDTFLQSLHELSTTAPTDSTAVKDAFIGVHSACSAVKAVQHKFNSVITQALQGSLASIAAAPNAQDLQRALDRAVDVFDGDVANGADLDRSRKVLESTTCHYMLGSYQLQMRRNHALAEQLVHVMIRLRAFFKQSAMAISQHLTNYRQLLSSLREEQVSLAEKLKPVKHKLSALETTLAKEDKPQSRRRRSRRSSGSGGGSKGSKPSKAATGSAAKSLGKDVPLPQVSESQEHDNLGIDASLPEDCKAFLRRVFQQPSGDRCADCHEPDPTWAATDLGCLLCSVCAELHRDKHLGSDAPNSFLGTPRHTSQLRSLQGGDLQVADVLMLKAIGNDCLNDVLEANLSEGQRPGREASYEQRRQFLRNKYENHDYFQPSADLTSFVAALRQGSYALCGVAPVLLRVLVAGADPTSEDAVDALHLAVAEDNLLAVDFLLRNGVPVDARLRSFTALHVASQMDRLECAKLLLRHGADWTAKDNSHQTPLDIARVRNSVGCSYLLSAVQEGRLAQVLRLPVDIGAWASSEDAVSYTSQTEELTLEDDGHDVSPLRETVDFTATLAYAAQSASTKASDRPNTKSHDGGGGDGHEGDATTTAQGPLQSAVHKGGGQKKDSTILPATKLAPVSVGSETHDTKPAPASFPSEQENASGGKMAAGVADMDQDSDPLYASIDDLDVVSAGPPPKPALPPRSSISLQRHGHEASASKAAGPALPARSSVSSQRTGKSDLSHSHTPSRPAPPPPRQPATSKIESEYGFLDAPKKRSAAQVKPDENASSYSDGDDSDDSPQIDVDALYAQVNKPAKAHSDVSRPSDGIGPNEGARTSQTRPSGPFVSGTSDAEQQSSRSMLDLGAPPPPPPPVPRDTGARPGRPAPRPSRPPAPKGGKLAPRVKSLAKPPPAGDDAANSEVAERMRSKSLSQQALSQPHAASGASHDAKVSFGHVVGDTGTGESNDPASASAASRSKRSQSMSTNAVQPEGKAGGGKTKKAPPPRPPPPAQEATSANRHGHSEPTAARRNSARKPAPAPPPGVQPAPVLRRESTRGSRSDRGGDVKDAHAHADSLSPASASTRRGSGRPRSTSPKMQQGVSKTPGAAHGQAGRPTQARLMQQAPPPPVPPPDSRERPSAEDKDVSGAARHASTGRPAQVTGSDADGTAIYANMPVSWKESQAYYDNLTYDVAVAVSSALRSLSSQQTDSNARPTSHDSDVQGQASSDSAADFENIKPLVFSRDDRENLYDNPKVVIDAEGGDNVAEAGSQHAASRTAGDDTPVSQEPLYRNIDDVVDSSRDC